MRCYSLRLLQRVQFSWTAAKNMGYGMNKSLCMFSVGLIVWIYRFDIIMQVGNIRAELSVQ
jgi:hypothetical protein